MTIAYISHTSCQLHSNGSSYHPERPARLESINDHLISSGLLQVTASYEAQAARREDLLLAHSPEHVENIFSVAPAEEEGLVYLDGDTAMNKHSLEAALYAAGAVLQGIDLVMAGTHGQVFCGVRPPGHHAGIHRASGFCIFNSIAIGALYAQEKHGLERVAVVDFDVHHGNGTEEILADKPGVLFCSSFQHPYYPYSGETPRADNILNQPLPHGTNGSQWRDVVEKSWLPALRDFSPQLILISAGFDSHLEDDMGGFGLREADYAWVTRELMWIAHESAEGRVVSSLEGGYDLSSLGRSVVAHMKAMIEG